MNRDTNHLERCILGSLLLDCERILDLNGTIEAEHFASEAHQLLWKHVLAEVQGGKKVDLVTVGETLTRSPATLRGWTLMDLSLLDGTPALLEHHAAKLREAALRRQLAVSGHALLHAAEAPDAEERAHEIAQRVLGMSVSSDDWAPMSEAMAEAWDEIGAACEAAEEGRSPGLPTGLMNWDHITSGLRPGELTILAARPRMGKTALALQVALNVANAGTPVAIASLEMRRSNLAARMMSNAAKVDAGRIRRGELTTEDHERLDGVEHLAQLPLFLWDKPGLLASSLVGMVRRLKTKAPGLGLVVVDYLQLMRGSSTARNREQEVAEISRALKGLSLSENIHVLALSQLNRQVEARKEKMPSLADLRESGSLEQDADVILGMYRPYEYDQMARPDQALLSFLKNRHGETSRFELTWSGRHQRFEDPTDRWSGRATSAAF